MPQATKALSNFSSISLNNLDARKQGQAVKFTLKILLKEESTMFSSLKHEQHHDDVLPTNPSIRIMLKYKLLSII